MMQAKVWLLNISETISSEFNLGKNQTTIGKHSHRTLVTIPYFS